MNPATWTLRPEALFYMALPLASVLATPARFAAVCAVAVSVVLWRTGLNGGGVWVHFLFGMAAAHLHVRFPSIPFLATPPAAAACLAIVLTAAATHHYGYGLSYAALAFPMFVSVVYGNDYFGLLRLNATRWLGEISYSVYLLHGLVLYAVFGLAAAWLPMGELGPLQFWSLAAVAAVGLVALSTLTFLKIERPFLSAGRPAAEGVQAAARAGAG